MWVCFVPVITHITITVMINREGCLLSSLFPGECFLFVFGVEAPPPSGPGPPHSPGF